MRHEPCENCVYSIYRGDHEVGLISLCDGGYHFICINCESREVWDAPEDGFERARFDGMIEDMVNAHLAGQLFVNCPEDEPEPSPLRIPFWRRVMVAARVLRTKYVQLD